VILLLPRIWNLILRRSCLASQRSQLSLSRNMRQLDFFLLVTHMPLLMSKSLLPKLMKSSCFTTSSHTDSDYPAILFFLRFWTDFLWRFISYRRTRSWNFRSSFGLWRPSSVRSALTYSRACLNLSLRRIFSNLMMVSIMRQITRAVPSTPVGRIHEKVWPEFSSHLAARPTSPRIGVHTGYTWKLTCPRFQATLGRLILCTLPSK
jgi:hypothetical protein